MWEEEGKERQTEGVLREWEEGIGESVCVCV